MHRDIQSFIKNFVICQHTNYQVRHQAPLVFYSPFLFQPMFGRIFHQISSRDCHLPMRTQSSQWWQSIAFPKAYTLYHHTSQLTRLWHSLLTLCARYMVFPRAQYCIVTRYSFVVFGRVAQIKRNNVGIRSSYYPQTDRQIKVTNRIVKQYLRSFAHDCPSHWFHFLHRVELRYNTSHHTYAGITPFSSIVR